MGKFSAVLLVSVFAILCFFSKGELQIFFGFMTFLTLNGVFD